MMSTPRAPSIEASSIVLEIAFRAALTARLSPEAWPTPISAEPASFMTAFTSAKSVLMSPGVVMRVVIPRTPWTNTSSASSNAASSDVLSSEMVSRRSLGMTIWVSTLSLSWTMPCSAWTARRRPSNPKGLVTTPMVRAPTAMATSATTGAAPVPVPPPSPAVMKTMSAPSMASSISPRCSSAAWRPISGSPPAPRPLVSSRPMSNFTSASLMSRACASVFTAMNSTPRMPASIIRLTALTPAPPMPITLITAR